MSKFAFVFPGQGAQAVGMLNGFADNKAAKQTIEEASDALGFDLGKLIAEGPKKEMDLTTNTQPIMLTAGIACYRAWIAAGGKKPDIVAGHSLGEYAALVASGVIQFKDAVPLVRFRAQVMQEAVPVGKGGMAAILGLPDEDVCAACDEASVDGMIAEPANFNAPSQLVIAGDKAAVEKACEIAKEKGAKRAIVLPVSAPFHSSLLKPALGKLREYIFKLNFAEPEIPVINNVDVAIISVSADIQDSLVRQAAAPVRWVETIKKMAAHGVTHVVECGPGRVLSSLSSRIEKSLVSEAIYDQITLEKVLEILK